ncbi:MAG: rane protein [Rhodospirillales bacterium]|nr:rane protein [Rhodospirillales bacterium]
MSEIFREIDEELRRDNYAKLWARYGHYLVGLVVLIVVATAAVVGWRGYQAGQQRAESVRYAAALDLAKKGQLAPAADAFALLAREGGAGVAALARLQEAALRAQTGDEPAAAAAYKALAADTSVDLSYRDLATLLLGFQDLKSADPKVAIADVAPLMAPTNPWRFSATEVTALADLRNGDRAAARTLYKQLADDLSAPSGLRARAAEMSAALAD